jgi:hypothetical protein
MARRHATIPLMVGVALRLHSVEGDDLGIAHVPAPVAIGDMVATVDGTYRVVDVVTSPPESPIAAMAKVRPVRLHVVAG